MNMIQDITKKKGAFDVSLRSERFSFLAGNDEEKSLWIEKISHAVQKTNILLIASDAYDEDFLQDDWDDNDDHVKSNRG